MRHRNEERLDIMHLLAIVAKCRWRKHAFRVATRKQLHRRVSISMPYWTLCFETATRAVVGSAVATVAVPTAAPNFFRKNRRALESFASLEFDWYMPTSRLCFN